MKRRRVLIVMAAVFVVAVLAVVLWPGEREPEYQGKKLSEWLGTYDSNLMSNKFPTMLEMEEAADALRHIGTNAVPVLLGWLGHEPWPLRTKLRRVFQKVHPEPIERVMPRAAREFRPNRLAMYGFIILGREASPAIPELNRLERATDPPYVSSLAKRALSYIQGDRLSVSLAMLGDATSPPLLRALTVHNISLVASNAPDVQSALVNALQDRDFCVRYYATNELLRIAPEMLTNGVTGTHGK